jgi:hypothetical protein
MNRTRATFFNWPRRCLVFSWIPFFLAFLCLSQPLSTNQSSVEPKPSLEYKTLMHIQGKETDCFIRAWLVLPGSGEGCPFTPFDGPSVYPPGTTAIAYRVVFDPPAFAEMCPDVRFQIILEAGDIEGSRCNSFAIVRGRPINFAWTDVSRQKSGQAFKPGIYQFSMLSGTKTLVETSFEIK